MLYLIPNLLGLCPPERVLPVATLIKTRALTHFVVETPKAARAFLATLNMPCPIRDLNLLAVADQPFQEVKALWAKGEAVGLLSDAGCPGVADPGASLVAWAHQHRVPVVPLVGPSSILLGLMASGMNGQSFTFHGYLPQDKTQLALRLQALSSLVQKQGSTELFIETPYRHASLLTHIKTHIHPEVSLCIAQGLTTDEERILTLPLKHWNDELLATFAHKIPSLFLLGKTVTN